MLSLIFEELYKSNIPHDPSADSLKS